MKKQTSELLQEHYFYGEHPSGLPVYVFPKQLTSTYAILAVRYGSADSSFRQAGDTQWTTVPDGVAHFLEHKLFDNPDGSDSFTRFSELGADANAYTTCNRTAYLFSCTDRFEESLSELISFVTTPYFTPQTVQKEQGIIAEEIRMYRDSPWDRCFQNLMEGLYQANPIRKNICGSVSSIAKITDRMLYDCYRSFYRLPNMVLAVCGNVTPEQVMRVADGILPQEKQAFSIERKAVHEPPEAYKSLREARMQVSKPIFSIGIKDSDIPADSAARARRDAAMSILEEILFSRSGSFYSNLFEEGLLTASYSYGYSITDCVAFHTLSGESDRPQEVRQRLRHYLEQIAREGIPREDFERCRRVLYADELRSYDSTEEIANNLLTFVLDGTDLFNYPVLLQSIRYEELAPLLQSMLRENADCLSVILPLEEAASEQTSGLCAEQS